MLFALSLLAGTVPTAARAASDHQCRTVVQCRHAVAWQRTRNAALHHRLATIERRDSLYAVRLAAAAFGLPYSKLRCIAERESGMGAQTFPESSSGASGTMQFLPSTWRRTAVGQAGFSIWDPVANVIAGAALIVADGSAREWVTGRGCGL